MSRSSAEGGRKPPPDTAKLTWSSHVPCWRDTPPGSCDAQSCGEEPASDLIGRTQLDGTVDTCIRILPTFLSDSQVGRVEPQPPVVWLRLDQPFQKPDGILSGDASKPRRPVPYAPQILDHQCPRLDLHRLRKGRFRFVKPTCGQERREVPEIRRRVFWLHRQNPLAVPEQRGNARLG